MKPKLANASRLKRKKYKRLFRGLIGNTGSPGHKLKEKVIEAGN